MTQRPETELRTILLTVLGCIVANTLAMRLSDIFPHTSKKQDAWIYVILSILLTVLAAMYMFIIPTKEWMSVSSIVFSAVSGVCIGRAKATWKKFEFGIKQFF